MFNDNYLLSLAMKRKGYTEEYVGHIQQASHRPLLNIEKFSEFLHKNQGLTYTIMQDFDTDGTCAGTLGFAGLSELGFKCHLNTPSPDTGYGIKPGMVDDVIRQFPDTNVIITCDQGIDCHEAVAYAKQKGLYVIVTDHHPKDDKKPLVPADIVIDPMLPEDPYEHPEICGAYVLWQCIYDYASKYSTPFLKTQIWRLRVFAGIGTVGDQMPMLYENRQVVKEAIGFCSMMLSDENELMESLVSGCSTYQRAFHGLRALIKCLQEQKKLTEIDEGTFGFYISPIINAVKRMQNTMYPLYRLFFQCGDDERRQEICMELLENNENRKELVKDYYDKILASKQQYAPHIYISSAPPKILGLIANKLMEPSIAPVLAITKMPGGEYKGSGRSPRWCDIREAMKTLPGGQGTMEVKGHAHAFAFTIYTEPDMERLYRHLSKLSQEHASIQGETKSGGLPPCDLVIGDRRDICDAPFSLLDIIQYAYLIKQFGPFGEGFERPTLLFIFHKENMEIQKIGKKLQHTKCTHKATGFPFLSWNQDAYNLPLHDGCLWAKGDVSLSEFKDVRAIQFTGKFI